MSDAAAIRRGELGRYLRIAAALVALAVGVLLAACGDDENAASGADGLESDQVIFADYGGTTRDAATTAFFEPFEEETGVRVVPADADPSKLQLFAQNERAEWDLIDTDAWDIVRFADQGLLQELPDDVARAPEVPEAYRDYASGGYNSSVLIAYNTGEVKPRTWADFFDTEKFPGKRALPSFPLLQVEAALLADGVPCDELYPLDFERAFAKLDEIRDDLLFYESFGQGMQFVAQGSASMALQPNGRPQVLKDQGLPVDLNWNEALHIPWVAKVIPAHAPHPDAAAAMVDFMHQPEHQAQFARMTSYGPMNRDALDLLDEATLEKLPNTDEHLEIACQIDPVAMARQYDEYVKRYSEWLAKG